MRSNKAFWKIYDLTKLKLVFVHCEFIRKIHQNMHEKVKFIILLEFLTVKLSNINLNTQTLYSNFYKWQQVYTTNRFPFSVYQTFIAKKEKNTIMSFTEMLIKYLLYLHIEWICKLPDCVTPNNSTHMHKFCLCSTKFHNETYIRLDENIEQICRSINIRCHIKKYRAEKQIQKVKYF